MVKQRADWFCQDCRVTMIYDTKNDRHVCPNCKAQVWHYNHDDPVVEDEITKLMREKYKSNLPPVNPIPAGGPSKGGGGSKAKGRSNKGAMQKKSLSQINAGLNGRCQSFDT